MYLAFWTCSWLLCCTPPACAWVDGRAAHTLIIHLGICQVVVASCGASTRMQSHRGEAGGDRCAMASGQLLAAFLATFSAFFSLAVFSGFFLSPFFWFMPFMERSCARGFAAEAW